MEARAGSAARAPFPKRDETAVPAEDLIRIDACWSVAHCFGFIDSLRAAEFHASHLLFALRAGEVYRVARALLVEAGYSAFSGGRGRKRTQDLIARGMELSQSCGRPHAIALVPLVSGVAAFLEGRWQSAREFLENAEIVLQERCVGVAWELATARLMGCASSYFMGDLRELSRRVPALIRDADARGDLYEATAMRARLEHIISLAANEPDVAREKVVDAIARWPGRAFQTQHWWSLVAQAETMLYTGPSTRAFDLWTANWKDIRRSHILRLQYILIETYHQRAASALAAAAGRERFLKIAERDAARIARENMPWGNALATLIRAGVAAARSRTQQSITLFATAEEMFETAGMTLFAAAARRRRGELLGGDEGRDLIASADSRMSAQNITRPDRFTAMLAPGAN